MNDDENKETDVSNETKTSLEEQVTDRKLLASLRSTTCPACGQHKGAKKWFCAAEFYSLPREHRLNLYRPYGYGYREAVLDAMRHLGVDEFLMPAGYGGEKAGA